MSAFRPLLRTLTVGALALLTVAPATAQAVRGEVVEEATGRPLWGAFVVLVDDAGVRHEGVLTDSTGGFAIRAAKPGRYRLVAELIGYAGGESPPFELTAGPAVEQRLEVPVQAVDLTGISVSTRARCRARPGTGPETAALWEEARKALQVAWWGEEQKALRMRIMQYARELSPNAHSVREASQRSRVGYYSSSPYVSRPAEELERLGYIREVEGEAGKFDYFGPDAAVLLSETFLGSHCFSVVAGPEEEPDLVGLAFEPVRGRDLPDVKGVLWVDRASAELRRLDFEYTSLPFRGVTTRHAGGRVEYERLANGVWIVKRWRVRMPLVAMKPQPAYRSGMAALEIVALNEAGAEVQTVTDQQGVVLAEAAGGTVYGVVWDSIRGEPLAEAVVKLGDLETTTGQDGAYRFTDMPSGSYTVSFAHPGLDALGVELESRWVSVDGGTATRLPLGLPGPAALAAALCGDDGGALVYGTVTDESATWPVADALVRVEAAALASPRTVTADTAGVFRACIPAGGIVRLAAFRPGAALGMVATPGAAAGGASLELRPGTVQRQDLAVKAGAARVTATWTNEIRGKVLSRDGRAPIVGATVTLAAAGGEPLTSAITDEDGVFRVAHPGYGEAFSLRAEHLGYATAGGPVRFTQRDELALELLLAPQAIAMEPIVVVERRLDYLADTGYYLRKDRGLGRFIEAETLERYRPTLLTDIFRRTPGVKVLGNGMGADIEMVGAKRAAGWGEDPLNPRGGSGTGGLQCAPSVYVDGALIRPGGHPGRTYESFNGLVAPELIQAIEVYRRISEVPPVYSGELAACGVVAIWTRRPG
ncbi:MAG TPA: TonB-dependent receptor [Longimicrobiales bacterium]|nr:TonB-dependent receptor [Longimicrobiales bacterium]